MDKTQFQSVKSSLNIISNILKNKLGPLYVHLNKFRVSYGLAILLIIYITLTFYISTFLPDSFKDYSVYTNIALTLIGLFIYGKLLFNIYKGETILTKSISKKNIAIMFAIPFIVTILLVLFTNSYTASKTITYIMNGLVLLGVLMLVYIGIEKAPFLQNIKELLHNIPIINLIYHFIFYLPCVFDDIINVIRNSNSVISTPSYIYYILGIEGIIIASYFLIPILFRKIYAQKAKLLLDKPIKLDKIETHATYEELNGKTGDFANLNYNYGLSCWIFIHEQPPNQNETSNEYVSILNFGGKPNIEYNNELRKFRVSVNTKQINDNDEYIYGTDIIYETDKLKLQKWNNIVVNYLSGKMDVFINNELVATSIYDKDKILAYMELDNLTSGHNRGLSGGITNIQYYNEPISSRTLSWNYNTYKMMLET